MDPNDFPFLQQGTLLSDVPIDPTLMGGTPGSLPMDSSLGQSVSPIMETSPQDADASQGEAGSSVTTRAKTGCITCRLRKKRCDEGKPKCAACDRLGLQCLGYGAKRPKWLRDENNAKRAKLEIKEKVSMRRASRTKQTKKPGDTSGNDAGPSIGNGASIWEIGSDDGRQWDIPVAAAPAPVGPGMTSNSVQYTEPTNSISDLTTSNSPFAFANDPELDNVWKILFGSTNNFPQQEMPPVLDASQFFNSMNAPTAGPSTTLPKQNYLHHYLNVVLPLQYRFTGSLSIGEMVAPLAMARSEVLTSVSSLAALHLSVKRNKTLDPTDFLAALTGGPVATDDDALIAISAHQETLERLRFISSSDFTAEDIILCAMFAVSYSTFTGGTSKEWKEVLGVSQRCLSAALASSPELTGGRAPNPNSTSPWAKYRQLIEVMIWMDIIAAVSQTKGTRLLPIYRNILGTLPLISTTTPKVYMEKVMGGDSTTLLAMAETVALAEWRDRVEEAGCLNYDQLVQRAAPIEKLLNERAWRESHFDETLPPILNADGTVQQETDEAARLRVMSDVFFGAAKLYLASVVHGPYPRVPDIASAVQDIIEALHRLDIIMPDPDINRALVFPITLAGCLCETVSQQNFFRKRFGQLNEEASAFGNTRPALDLMEEVWRRRAVSERGSRIDWRQIMKEMGWEAGILLI